MLEGRQHFDPLEHPVIERLCAIEGLGLVVQGGPTSRGAFALLPGSQHPSGEVYRWADLAAARAAPAVVALNDVLKAIRLASGSAILAPSWLLTCDRVGFTKALAGILARAGASNLGKSP